VYRFDSLLLLDMRIFFRVDASIQIGTGHVMRCLTLADALHARGARCSFICRPHTGHLLDMIAQLGHHAVALPSLATTTNPMPADTAHATWLGTDWPTDAQQTAEALGGEGVDWLVVDHYALDHRWEQALRPHCLNLMVIDDLADRPHDCDVLLDQNLGRSAQDYDGLLKPQTTTYIGPQYALLRPEFAQLRSQSLARRVQPQLKHLLITMGGVDKDNATGQVLQALTACHMPADLRISVVMGPHAPCLADVQQQASRMPWPTQVLVGVNAMGQLMSDSDLCIGAAGSTTWERCCMGLPTLLLVLADNQLPGAQALEKAGAALAVGNDQTLSQVFEKHMQSGASVQLKSWALAAAAVTDGLGVQRIVAAMLMERLHD
jgi:UDP-2,4-diacetamido-2,4,6-trideoxy-beta-L-altropyranose hydrolase